MDEGQTQTLIQHGFKPPTVPTSGTGQDPENLLVILQDHMAALGAIYSQVRNGRSISRSPVRQIH